MQNVHTNKSAQQLTITMTYTSFLSGFFQTFFWLGHSIIKNQLTLE